VSVDVYDGGDGVFVRIKLHSQSSILGSRVLKVLDLLCMDRQSIYEWSRIFDQSNREQFLE
jgi:hypothetical protein